MSHYSFIDPNLGDVVLEVFPTSVGVLDGLNIYPERLRLIKIHKDIVSDSRAGMFAVSPTTGEFAMTPGFLKYD